MVAGNDVFKIWFTWWRESRSPSLSLLSILHFFARCHPPATEMLGRKTITPCFQAPVNTIIVSPPKRKFDEKTTNQNNALQSHIVKISIVPNTKLRTPKLQLPSVLLFASTNMGGLQPLINAIRACKLSKD